MVNANVEEILKRFKQNPTHEEAEKAVRELYGLKRAGSITEREERMIAAVVYDHLANQIKVTYKTAGGNVGQAKVNEVLRQDEEERIQKAKDEEEERARQEQLRLEQERVLRESKSFSGRAKTFGKAAAGTGKAALGAPGSAVKYGSYGIQKTPVLGDLLFGKVGEAKRMESIDPIVRSAINKGRKELQKWSKDNYEQVIKGKITATQEEISKLKKEIEPEERRIKEVISRINQLSVKEKMDENSPQGKAESGGGSGGATGGGLV